MRVRLKGYFTVLEAQRWIRSARRIHKQAYIEMSGGSRRPVDEARRGSDGSLQFHVIDDDSWHSLGPYDNMLVA